jgi:hypothetical protein
MFRPEMLEDWIMALIILSSLVSAVYLIFKKEKQVGY